MIGEVEGDANMIVPNNLILVILMWGALGIALLLFGIACIKWGVYTAGNRDYKPTLEI